MSITVYTSFQEIPSEIRKRLSYPCQPNFLLSFDWFSLLFESSLAQTLTPRIYVVLDENGTAVAALFCGIRRDGVLRRLVSLTNFYTLEYAPSVIPGVAANPDLTKQLVEHIACERPRWHIIDFKLLKTGMPEARFTSAYLSRAGFTTYPFFQFENWYGETTGKSFHNYFSERGSQLRNTIVRKQKKLEKTHSFAINLGRSGSQELDRLLRDFIAVYNHSWKRPEPFPNFIPMLVAACAKAGTLRLGMLYVDGKPAAGQLWINTDKKAIIYKLAYDEDYRALGVGSILSREMFRVAIDEDHVEEIDYGVGSEAYKKEWMSAARKITGVMAFNRKTMIGLLLIIRESTKVTVAVIFKRILDFWRDSRRSRHIVEQIPIIRSN
jgi:GNAT superfamily N-acetyltransferase